MSDPRQSGGKGPKGKPDGDELELDLPELKPSLPPARTAPSQPQARKSLGPRRDEAKQDGKGSLLGRLLGKLAGLLVRASTGAFKQAKTTGGRALDDFQRRPEHTQWRAYAFGTYGLLCVATFAFLIPLIPPMSLVTSFAFFFRTPKS